ncbi:MAG: hypothetical protein BZY87_00300 [SAR202 cluster bacterium Io17-Chloro-G6]|nr:MAG: hypothetical protein BZY87_00300 [SAR202 cluster bacterium Io17-Chloro-G6]
MADNSKTELDKSANLVAFEFTRSWSVLMITLSTGSILFTAVFQDKFGATGEGISSPEILLSSWILFGMSIIFGIGSIGSLVSQLIVSQGEYLDLYRNPIRIFFAFQLSFFLSGVGLVLVFVSQNLF